MPDKPAERGDEDRRLFLLAACATAAGVVAVFGLAPSQYPYWFDSWTYHELARSIGGHFYAVATVREFQTDASYSTAFPPLWPAVVAIVSRSGLGLFGSYLASFLCYAAFCVAAEDLARRLLARRGVGLLSALLALAFPGLRWDLAGGGSVALSLCLIALIGSLLLRPDSSRERQAVLLGALAGLMVMLRFDAAPAALVTLIAGIALGMRGRRALALVVVSLLVISPWVAYSWIHFHELFATDNGVVALALDPDAYVLDYLPTSAPTLRDDPVAWLHKIVVHVPVIARALANAAVESVFLLPLCLAALITAFAARREAAAAASRLPSGPCLALAAIVLAPICAYVVTGYHESRYFAAIVWLGELAALGVLVTLLSPRDWLLLCATLSVAGVMKSVALARHVRDVNPIAVMRAQLSTADTDALRACLLRAGAVPRQGVLFRTNVGLLNGYRFGALTGWRASPTPRNWGTLTSDERATFVRTYRLAFAIDTLPSGGSRLPSSAVAGCPPFVRRLTVAAR